MIDFLQSLEISASALRFHCRFNGRALINNLIVNKSFINQAIEIIFYFHRLNAQGLCSSLLAEILSDILGSSRTLKLPKVDSTYFFRLWWSRKLGAESWVESLVRIPSSLRHDEVDATSNNLLLDSHIIDEAWPRVARACLAGWSHLWIWQDWFSVILYFSFDKITLILWMDQNAMSFQDSQIFDQQLALSSDLSFDKLFHWRLWTLDALVSDVLIWPGDRHSLRLFWAWGNHRVLIRLDHWLHSSFWA